MSNRTIFTIGHSTRPIDAFIGLLKGWQIEAVADVRSSPWSRYNPQFNRPDLRVSLKEHHLHYRFFGRQLGGRPDKPELYDGGIADYIAMASTAEFSDGLALVMAGADKHRLALMCSEHDPIECHRCLLVGRRLDAHGYDMRHIISESEIQTQRDVEDRLLRVTGRDQHDFLKDGGDPLASAYRDWSRKVAYAEKPDIDLGQDIRYASS